MKAIVFPKYGDYQVLETAEVLLPKPKPDEVLIKVAASSVNKGDWHYIHGEPFPVRFMAGGLRTPKKDIPGGDVAGTVVKVGADVKGFNIGDEVFGDATVAGFGCWAEYVCTKTTALIPKPQQMGFDKAAAIPVAGITAYQGLIKHGKLASGMKVLVNGATGGVGMYAVQIAKTYGAEVTAVCSHDKIPMVEIIGAHHIIDYQAHDVTKNGQTYDLIIDTAAYRSFREFSRSLTGQGIYVLVGGGMKNLMQIMLFGALASKKGGKRYCNFLANPIAEDLNTLGQLYCDGKLDPYIDQTYQLEQAAKAFQRLSERKVMGKLVIEVS